MMGYTTQIASAIVGVAAMAGIIVVDDAIQPEAPIQPIKVELRADGTAYFDRDVQGDKAVDAIWSVIVIGLDGKPHCAGSGREEYEPGTLDRDPSAWTVSEFVGGDCTGIEEGMPYYVTWVPIDKDLPPSTWPTEGGGPARVLPGKE